LGGRVGTVGGRDDHVPLNLCRNELGRYDSTTHTLPLPACLPLLPSLCSPATLPHTACPLPHPLAHLHHTCLREGGEGRTGRHETLPVSKWAVGNPGHTGGELLGRLGWSAIPGRILSPPLPLLTPLPACHCSPSFCLCQNNLPLTTSHAFAAPCL